MNLKIIEHDWAWAHGLVKREVTDAINIHHAAAENASPEAVHAWHINNGWAGIGYHFLIRKDGSVHRGRPLWARGANVLNHNWHTIGVCCEGNYHVKGAVMPKAQMDALHEVLRYLKGIYPDAAIKFHRDYGGSVCPGDYFPYVEALNYNGTTAAQPVAANTSTKEIYDMILLKRGSKGYQVKAFQTLLILNGFSCGRFGADGDFGPATETSTKAYQKSRGLTVDGVIGPKTAAPLLGC